MSPNSSLNSLVISLYFNFNRVFIKCAFFYVVRCILGMTVLSSLQHLRRSITHKFGSQTATWHLLITSSQFHVMFYASRPLPNIFALALALIAASFWLRGNTGKFILTSAFVILVFRGELALLLGTMLLMDLVVGRTGLMKTIGFGLLGLLMSLAMTISIDTWMWQKQDWLWPEGQVLYYNVILNKSANWGVSPWPWYFYSAIPRAMFTSSIFVIVGAILDRRTWLLIIPSLTFVFLYSFLPHKELRFIIYVFPLLNVAAAEACKRLWEARSKPSIFRKLASLIAVGHLLTNILWSVFMLYISSHNYPGGTAMMKLHQMEDPNLHVNLHIDVYSAQTGVSRFLHMNSKWIYNKTEDLSNEDLKSFTHLLVQSNNEATLTFLKETHQVLTEVEAFAKINIKSFPPIKFEPSVTILKKRKASSSTTKI